MEGSLEGYDLIEMFLIRGYEFSLEAVREWEARFIVPANT